MFFIYNHDIIHFTGVTAAHNFAAQQQAGHAGHQIQSRHGSTHQR